MIILKCIPFLATVAFIASLILSPSLLLFLHQHDCHDHTTIIATSTSSLTSFIATSATTMSTYHCRFHHTDHLTSTPSLSLPCSQHPPPSALLCQFLAVQHLSLSLERGVLLISLSMGPSFFYSANCSCLEFFGAKGRKKIVWRLFPLAVCWCLWRERNRIDFDSK